MLNKYKFIKIVEEEFCKIIIYKITGRSLHCQVENHVRTKTKLLFLSCINKMGQNFIKKKSHEYIYMVSIT